MPPEHARSGQLCGCSLANKMNADPCTIFAALKPIEWSLMCELPPIERAKYFSIPGEESIEALAHAHSLITFIIDGSTNATVRHKYSSGDTFKADAFDLAANFYNGIFSAVRDIAQQQDAVIMKIWPNVEYFTFRKCSDICECLNKKVLARNSPTLRTFYPPWHMGCHGWIKSSKDGTSNTFRFKTNTLRIGYFCNPLDVAINLGIVRDFQGMSDIVNNKESTDLSDIVEKIEDF